MIASRDAISAESWIQSGKTESTRQRRQVITKRLAESNSKSTFAELLQDILSEKITVYQASLNFVDAARDMKLKPSTVEEYRSCLPDLWNNTLGESNFSRTVFENRVKAGDYYLSSTKEQPTDEELTNLIQLSSPRDRAVIGLLLTGARIGEVVTRKMNQIEAMKSESTGETYYRIKLVPKNTKSKYLRYIYFNQEVKKWIDAQHLDGSAWIFAGELGQHVDKMSIWASIKRLFDRAGLKDKVSVEEDEDGKETTHSNIYTVHSFRGFAENFMIRSGLKEKHVNAIIGHGGVQRNYDAWRETGEQWFNHMNKFTWSYKLVVDKKTEQKVEQLERVLKGLLGQVLTGGATIEGKDLTQEQRIERAIKLLEDKSEKSQAASQN